MSAAPRPAPASLAEWRARQKLTEAGAAGWLGFSEAFYKSMEYSHVGIDPAVALRVFEVTGVRLPELADEDAVTTVDRCDTQSAAAKCGVGADAVPTPPAPDGGAAPAAPAADRDAAPGAVPRLEVLSVIAVRHPRTDAAMPTVSLLSGDRREQYLIELSPDRAVRLAIELLQVAEAAR